MDGRDMAIFSQSLSAHRVCFDLNQLILEGFCGVSCTSFTTRSRLTGSCRGMCTLRSSTRNSRLNSCTVANSFYFGVMYLQYLIFACTFLTLLWVNDVKLSLLAAFSALRSYAISNRNLMLSSTIFTLNLVPIATNIVSLFFSLESSF